MGSVGIKLTTFELAIRLTLLFLSYRCSVTINVLWLLLTVPWVGLQCVIWVFPNHTHLLFTTYCDTGPDFGTDGIYIKSASSTAF